MGVCPSDKREERELGERESGQGLGRRSVSREEHDRGRRKVGCGGMRRPARRLTEGGEGAGWSAFNLHERRAGWEGALG